MEMTKTYHFKDFKLYFAFSTVIYRCFNVDIEHLEDYKGHYCKITFKKEEDKPLVENVYNGAIIDLAPRLAQNKIMCSSASDWLQCHYVG